MFGSRGIVKNDMESLPHLKERGVKHLKVSEGQKIYELYEFKEEIGHGSFGVVVMAIEKANNKSWAVKIVHKNIAGLNKLGQVDREINILKVVNHPHIVYLDRVYESPRKIYMVLELCHSELYKIYSARKPFQEKVSKRVILQLADAISYLHKNDIVHRDVKMENILLAVNKSDPSDEYYIKLTDFGLSIVKTGVGIKSLMTDYCGTILYMPPEILQMKTYSELCDVWAIGVIFYMMLYGRNPFIDKNDEATTYKICNVEPDYSSEGVSLEVIDLLKSILKKDPVQRITALQIKENPWLNDKRTRKGQDQNIVDMMKEFRHETARTESRRSRGLSMVCDGIFAEHISSLRLSQRRKSRDSREVKR